MVVVTNRFKIKPGLGAKIGPGFVRPTGLDAFEGFVKVEVLLSQYSPDFDELNVNMYWETLEHFEAWKNSDAFKNAHKRPEPGSEEAKKESPILGNQIILHEINATLEAATSK